MPFTTKQQVLPVACPIVQFFPWVLAGVDIVVQSEAKAAGLLVRVLVQTRFQCLLFPFLLHFILSNFLFEGEICSGEVIDNVEWLCWCLLVACLYHLFFSLET
jgi:hypothetical protein